jgi:hypothetical protein
VVVDLVTIHHEAGAGKPPTDDVDRFAHGGYTYGIGNTVWERFRSPSDSYATLNYNHVSLDICLSSDHHTVNQTTDEQIGLIHQAFMDCFNRGEVVAHPLVRAHRNSPGSATACPGDLTMNVWDKVARACSTDTPPEPKPPEEDEYMDLANALNHDGRRIVFQVGADEKLYYKVKDATGGGWGNWRDLSGGFAHFHTVTAWTNEREGETPWVEVWVTMKDGKSFHRWQEGDDRASWSGWNDETL